MIPSLPILENMMKKMTDEYDHYTPHARDMLDVIHRDVVKWYDKFAEHYTLEDIALMIQDEIHATFCERLIQRTLKAHKTRKLNADNS